MYNSLYDNVCIAQKCFHKLGAMLFNAAKALKYCNIQVQNNLLNWPRQADRTKSFFVNWLFLQGLRQIVFLLSPLRQNMPDENLAFKVWPRRISALCCNNQVQFVVALP